VAPLDRPVLFDTPLTGPISWKVELTALSPMAALRPTLSELTVDSGNNAPVVNGPVQIFGQLGQNIAPIQADVTDADGDRLTYNLSGLPTGSGLS